MKITYKLDIERLLQNNDRKLIKKLFREELAKYETHEKSYAKKEAHYV